MPIFEGLGRALRWLREGRGKRQYQVAETAGITKPMLSAYETGRQKPSLDTLEKILGAMGADLAELHAVLDIVNGRQPAPPQRDRWRDRDRGAGAALSEMAHGFEELIRLLHGAAERLVENTENAEDTRATEDGRGGEDDDPEDEDDGGEPDEA